MVKHAKEILELLNKIEYVNDEKTFDHKDIATELKISNADTLFALRHLLSKRYLILSGGSKGREAMIELKDGRVRISDNGITYLDEYWDNRIKSWADGHFKIIGIIGTAIGVLIAIKVALFP